MCASYGALESMLVSTRSTVPATLASAAFCTWDATEPVRACSVRPLRVWRPWSVAVGAPDGAADGVVVPDEAAFATVAPPTAAAPTAASAMSLERMLDMGPPIEWGMDRPLSRRLLRRPCGCAENALS